MSREEPSPEGGRFLGSTKFYIELAAGVLGLVAAAITILVFMGVFSNEPDDVKAKSDPPPNHVPVAKTEDKVVEAKLTAPRHAQAGKTYDIVVQGLRKGKGIGVEGAKVTLAASAGYFEDRNGDGKSVTGKTDSDGLFRAKWVATGIGSCTMEATVKHSGFTSGRVLQAVQLPTEVPPVDVVMTALGPGKEKQPTYTLEIQAVTGKSKVPLPNAKITLTTDSGNFYKKRTSSSAGLYRCGREISDAADASGIYRVAWIPDSTPTKGTIVAVATKEGYGSGRDSKTIDVPPEEMKVDFKFRKGKVSFEEPFKAKIVKDAHYFKLSVINARTREPIYKAKVMLKATSGQILRQGDTGIAGGKIQRTETFTDGSYPHRFKRFIGIAAKYKPWISEVFWTGEDAPKATIEAVVTKDGLEPARVQATYSEKKKTFEQKKTD